MVAEGLTRILDPAPTTASPLTTRGAACARFRRGGVVVVAKHVPSREEAADGYIVSVPSSIVIVAVVDASCILLSTSFVTVPVTATVLFVTVSGSRLTCKATYTVHSFFVRGGESQRSHGTTRIDVH